MSQGQYEKARLILERVTKNVAPADLNRAQVINLAIIDYIQRRNAMRAVKNLMNYVAAHPGPPDEALVEVFGAALTVAGKSPTLAKAPLFADGTKAYQELLRSLEATRPGMRRWGNQWMTDAEFSGIDAKLKEANATIERANQDASKAIVDLRAAEQQVANAQQVIVGTSHVHRDSTDGPSVVCSKCSAARAAQQRLQEAERNVAIARQKQRDAESKVVAARRTFPQPVWPATFPPVEEPGAAEVATTQPDAGGSVGAVESRSAPNHAP
jgi:hypothetical protein